MTIWELTGAKLESLKTRNIDDHEVFVTYVYKLGQNMKIMEKKNEKEELLVHMSTASCNNRFNLFGH